MRTHGTGTVFAGVALAFATACNINAPVDPANVVRPIDDLINTVDRTIDNLLTDPLGTKPFPVLAGGDNQRVFYTTNLGDIRINFPGPTNDAVIPGFVGPSNLYRYEAKRRELIRPLIPGGSFLGLASDGQRIAYIAITDLNTLNKQVVVAEVNSLQSRVIYDDTHDESTKVLTSQLALSNGRLAFVLVNVNDGSERLRVEDLIGIEPTLEIEADAFWRFNIRGDRLAYIAASTDGTVELRLHRLSTGESTVIASSIRAEFPIDVRLTLTDNLVVWSETTFTGTSRVMAYHVVDASTRVLADSAVGVLVGANDEFFVTEEYVVRFPQRPNLFKVRRYAHDGQVRVLAEFRADGLAGQTTVLNDRAAWVNPERKIVLAPLRGGDRTIFAPF
jgi:hypothetical protein